MSKLRKLVKVDDSFTVNRYDNGFMVEFNGRNDIDDWAGCKVVCNTVDDLFEVIKESLTIEVNR
jgi:hypothetical protein